MKKFLVIGGWLLISACSQLPSRTANTVDQELANIIDAYQGFVERNSVYSPPEKGGNNAKLPDLSPEHLAKLHQKNSEFYQQLQQLAYNNLSADNQINWSVLTYRIKNDIDGFINKEHYMPLTAESGFHVWISRIAQRVKFAQEQDYVDYLARLNSIPHYFDQQIAWMEQGLEQGITQPQVVLTGFEKSIIAYITDDVEQSDYYAPFAHMPEYISVERQQQLRQLAKEAINEQVFPAYQKFYQFMTERYQPNARQNIAAISLPQGEAYYQNRVAHYTTLPMTAAEVHQTGLAEVARIRAEMEAIIKDVGFDGSFADFIDYLRTDPQFYAKTAEELIKEASYLSKLMDAKLPSLFKHLPRTPYGVEPVPETIAPKYTTGRYLSPSRDDKGGTYWVNTYRLDRRPLYVLPALTLHEAVPGHHLQGSIAREMDNVPEFRTQTYISAFGEGWGLYSEFLGIEAGIYQTPYQHFGRLTYEMWRACRLVVDTGMHSQGWTRQQAIDYLASNTALSLHNVTTEIDRYISWPGQALSYKMGELTIKKLRQQAQQQLGADFDLRLFHDELLKNGSMPLSMLEQVIAKFINEQKENKKGKE